MANWQKIRFYWQTMLGAAGSTLTASGTAAGDYSPDYLYNMSETNFWKAAGSAGPQYLSFDSGAGSSFGADYIALHGHNLKTANASVTLEYSDDGVNYAQAFAPFIPGTDRTVIKEFSSPGAKRYWRLKLEGMSLPPYMAICIWGLATELDFASSDFDPHAEECRANVNLSQGGYAAGTHALYTEREIDVRFEDADSLLYSKIRDWRENSGLKNFFMAWEAGNSPDECYLVRPDPRFNNPLKAGGIYRDINLKLFGRKE